MSGAKANTPGDWRQLSRQLPVPQDEADARDQLWQLFTAQFRWYDHAATRCRATYQGLRLLVVAAGASVAVLAAAGVPPLVTALVGALIVFCEGLQQVGQFHARWLNYRATAEKMRHEGFLYAARAGAYAATTHRRELLSRFMAQTFSSENRSWSETAKKADKPSEG